MWFLTLTVFLLIFLIHSVMCQKRQVTEDIKKSRKEKIIPVDIKTFQTQLQIWPIVRRLTDRPLLPVAAQTSVSQTIRKPPLVKAQTAFLKIKYGEKRFSIRRMEFLHPVMWYDRDIDFAR